MTPAALAQAEQQAHARLKAEATEEAHHAWLEARHAIEAHIRSVGSVVEHHHAGRYTVYSLGYFNTLHKASFAYGRPTWSSRWQSHSSPRPSSRAQSTST